LNHGTPFYDGLFPFVFEMLSSQKNEIQTIVILLFQL